jgi:hypothetical protein
MTTWAKNRAKELLARLQDTIRERVSEIIQQGMLDQRTPKEIVQEVHDYLRSAAFLEDLANNVAWTDVVEAIHAGAYRTSMLLGATHKAWISAIDAGVCPNCLMNAAEGIVSGDHVWISAAGAMLYPPAHPACRCTVVYLGVDEDSIAQAIANA